MKVVDFFDYIEFFVGAVVSSDVFDGEILVTAPVGEVLVEEYSVFFEEFIEVGIFIGGKAIHEGNAEMKESVSIHIVEIILVFGFRVKVADFLHGGISLGYDFGFDSIDDGIFSDHVAVQTIGDEGDFVGININELKEHHVIEDWWDVF